MVHSGVFYISVRRRGPTSVAGPEVAYPPTPPSRRACTEATDDATVMQRFLFPAILDNEVYLLVFDVITKKTVNRQLKLFGDQAWPSVKVILIGYLW